MERTEERGKIVLDRIEKTYETEQKQKLEVLRDVTYSVEEGDFVTIIGPSGCGKSTLLNIIAGLVRPTGGNVYLDGEVVDRPRKELGMIFQQDAIFLWRTVAGNVQFGLEMQGLPRDERKAIADNYLKLVGLTRFAGYYPKELSGGMRKRVAIATVLANQPEILLMDEPFGSLDYVTKIGLQKEVLRIWQNEKITTIFVTHDIEEALFISTKVLVLLGGMINDVVDVPFDYPRTDSLRTGQDFQVMKEKLWKYMVPESD